MEDIVDSKISVIVPNWNGKDVLAACLESLRSQSLAARVIVVENGSIDGSLEFLRQNYPDVEVLPQKKNLGFAGGVNVGLRRSMELDDEFVALFNNDAVADKDWLKNLVGALESNQATGVVACKLLDAEGKKIDSTGEFYTVWGLSYPRGRSETELNKYDSQTEVFGASGGASLYRVKMLEEIGLFDEDFFAYYEDGDISFRAQLAGWKVAYEPSSIAYHQIGATSGSIKGFTTYQTLKNLPMLLLKNVPRKYLWRVSWRYLLAQELFFWRAVSRGQGWPALKGKLRFIYLLPRTFSKRRRIQRSKSVSDKYIWDLMVRDLPPNAKALRTLRSRWWKLQGKKS